jgi:hypothetical protein
VVTGRRERAQSAAGRQALVVGGVVYGDGNRRVPDAMVSGGSASLITQHAIGTGATAAHHGTSGHAGAAQDRHRGHSWPQTTRFQTRGPRAAKKRREQAGEGTLDVLFAGRGRVGERLTGPVICGAK